MTNFVARSVESLNSGSSRCGALPRRVEAAERLEHVDLNGELLSAGLARDRAKQIVLKRLVLGARRNSAANVSGVHALRRRRVGIVEVERTEIRRLELDADRAISRAIRASVGLTTVARIRRASRAAL